SSALGPPSPRAPSGRRWRLAVAGGLPTARVRRRAIRSVETGGASSESIATATDLLSISSDCTRSRDIDYLRRPLKHGVCQGSRRRKYWEFDKAPDPRGGSELTPWEDRFNW